MNLELRVKDSEAGQPRVKVEFSEYVIYSGIKENYHEFLKITSGGVELSTKFPKSCIKSISVNLGERKPTIVFNDEVRFYGHSLPTTKPITFGKSVVGALFSYKSGNLFSNILGISEEVFLSIAWRYIDMIFTRDGKPLIEFFERPDYDYYEDM